MPEPRQKDWLVVIPVFTHVLPQAFYNFLVLFTAAGRDLPQHRLHLMPAERQLLHMAMNQAVDVTLANGFDGMLAFDDDCLPPDHAIARLIAHAERGRDFVAGMGFMRNYPHTTTIGKYYREGLTYRPDTHEASTFEWLDRLPMKERGLIEADFCGLPIAIWTRRALERMPKPVFGTAGPDGGQMTHDVFMCGRLREAGIPVLVDTSIECGHIGPAPLITSVTREAARAAVRITDEAVRRQKVVEAPAV
jgi:hypothetical protein